MAGKRSSPFRAMSTRRWTPVVVSSVTPLMPLAMDVQRPWSSARLRAERGEDDLELLGVGGRGVGHARPPSRTRRPCARGGWRRHRRRGSCWGRPRRATAGPARCTTSTPRASRPSRRRRARPGGPRPCRSGPTATAAAAWSWVEKMLQLHQRTRAPSAVRVSISTAVWTVMCREPVTRAPARGWDGAELGPHGHEAGHLVLGQLDLLAAERGQGEVGDLEGVGGSHCVLLWVDERAQARSTAAGRTAEAQRTCSDLCRRPRTHR